ncbi:hypothetical protein A2U01_0106302, partial [Trifolium medium]|nr:hypothetical protein [Trifolium medium]
VAESKSPPLNTTTHAPPLLLPSNTTSGWNRHRRNRTPPPLSRRCSPTVLPLTVASPLTFLFHAI